MDCLTGINEDMMCVEPPTSGWLRDRLNSILKKRRGVRLKVEIAYSA